MVLGSHNIQVGLDLRLMQQNTLSSGLLYSCCGSYDFTSANPTASGNANIPTGSGGYPFASFMLGVPKPLQLAGARLPSYHRYQTAAAYVHEHFQETSRVAPYV